MLIPKKINIGFSINLFPPSIVYGEEVYPTSLEIIQDIISSFSIKNGKIDIYAILAVDENGLYHLIQERKKLAGSSKSVSSSNFKFESGDVCYINAFQFYKKEEIDGKEQIISTRDFTTYIYEAIYMGKIERNHITKLNANNTFYLNYKEVFDVFYVPELDLVSTSPNVVCINENNVVINKDYRYINSEKDFLKSKMIIHNDDFFNIFTSFLEDRQNKSIDAMFFNCSLAKSDSKKLILKNKRKIIEEFNF